MSTLPFRSRFNWVVVDGDPSRQITYNIQANEPSEPVPQDRLLNPDGCVVLASPSSPEELAKAKFCEQMISVNPVYQVMRLGLIAECVKLEFHVGRTLEYYQTYQGELIFHNDDSQLYRFEILLENSGISDFMLRFITPPEEPLCLYGMHLLVARNTNPLGLLASDSTLNRAMIDCQLDDRTLSDAAAKCKAFIVASMKSRMFCGGPSNRQQLQQLNVANNNPNESTATPSELSDNSSIGNNATLPLGNEPPNESAALRYIDEKFQQLEAMLDAKLQALEMRQNEKLDQILALLQPNANANQ